MFRHNTHFLIPSEQPGPFCGSGFSFNSSEAPGSMLGKNMNNSSDAHPRESWHESRVQPLDSGKDCPPFKSQLFALADAVIAQKMLDDEQQVLMGHIEKCHMCRSIYSGAIYFSQTSFEVPSPNVADEIVSGLASNPLRRLKMSQKKCPVSEVPLSVHFHDVCEGAGLSIDDALQSLPLARGISLADLDVQPQAGISAACAIGIEERLAVSWFRFSYVRQQSQSSASEERAMAMRSAIMAPRNTILCEGDFENCISTFDTRGRVGGGDARN